MGYGLHQYNWQINLLKRWFFSFCVNQWNCLMEFMRAAYGKLTFIGCGNDRHFLEMLAWFPQTRWLASIGVSNSQHSQHLLLKWIFLKYEAFYKCRAGDLKNIHSTSWPAWARKGTGFLLRALWEGKQPPTEAPDYLPTSPWSGTTIHETASFQDGFKDTPLSCGFYDIIVHRAATTF